MDTSLMLYISLYGIGLLIAIFLARAIFSIPTIVNQLKLQTQLLTEIAKSNGVTVEQKNQSSDSISDDELEKEALSYPKE
jgi:hypothetical protein